MATKGANNVSQRKGARKAADIPPLLLQQLNLAQLPTVNLVEWMAINRRVMLGEVLKQCNRALHSKYFG